LEPLITAIKRNDEIKGIEIEGIEILTTQYADDAIFCLDGSEKSFQNTFKTFSSFSGLVINCDKTRAICLMVWG
jgi:hypothetical protein